MSQIRLVRAGNLLFVLGSKEEKLPSDVIQLLHPKLSYDYRQMNYGQRAFDPMTGRKSRMTVVQKRLFGVDNAGRLYTNFGLYKRVTDALTENKISYSFQDMNDKKPCRQHRERPDRYFIDPGNVTYHFTLRVRQDECLKQIVDNPCGLVHAVTGFGKMAIGAMVCLLYPKAKIHIVTRRRPIVSKWVEYLTRYVPNVGQVGAGSRRMGDRVTVFTAKSIAYSDFDCDILIGDEAHEIISDETVALLARYHNTKNIALTASPFGRSDGADLRLEAIFGPRIFYLPYWDAVELNLVVPIQVRWYDVILPNNPAAGYEDIARRRHGIWLNSGRNDIIAKAFLSVPSNEQKLVLCETLYQAVEIYKRLRHTGVRLVYDTIDKDRFEGYKITGSLPPDLPKMTPSIKEAYRKQFEAGEGSFIATPTWAVGIDPIHLQHVFMAAAWQSEILCTQGPGRVSRINNEKQYGIIHDFRDQFDKTISHWAARRYAIYRRLRWAQVPASLDGQLVTEGHDVSSQD